MLDTFLIHGIENHNVKKGKDHRLPWFIKKNGGQTGYQYYTYNKLCYFHSA